MKEKKEKERKSRNFVVLRARLSLFYHYFSLSSFLFFSMPRETKRNLHDLIVFDQKNATISLRSLLERILLFRMIRKNKNSHHFFTYTYVRISKRNEGSSFVHRQKLLFRLLEAYRVRESNVFTLFIYYSFLSYRSKQRRRSSASNDWQFPHD